MEPLEKLWSYMQEDMQADRIDAEIRRSPLRQKLEKTRDFIMEQQKNYKDMEEHVAVSLDRKDAIRDALERSREQLAALQDKYKNLPESDLDSVKSLMADVDKLRKTIQSYEQEMRRLHKEGMNWTTKRARSGMRRQWPSRILTACARSTTANPRRKRLSWKSSAPRRTPCSIPSIRTFWRPTIQ